MTGIPGYSNYAYHYGRIFNLLTGKEISQTFSGERISRLKMRNDEGIWKSTSKAVIEALVGMCIHIPCDAVPIKRSNNALIDPRGVVYSFTPHYPTGIIHKQSIDTSGYPRVSIEYDGLNVYMNLHRLLGETFLLEDYVDQGLCCMHLDNNKLNYSIDNLLIGTYSENNKQAYDDGINLGRKKPN